MRTFLTISAFIFSSISFGQINGTWYTFKVNDLAFVTINSKYLIQGTISNYNTPKQYYSRVDTFTIKQEFTKGDSLLYLVTNKEMDLLSKYSGNKELFIHKFQYNKVSNTLSTYFFTTLKNYFELIDKKKQITLKEIAQFVKVDTSKDSYLTYYKIDSIRTFIKYPKLIEQPMETVLELYKKLTFVYEKLKVIPKEKQMAYAGLWSMLSSVIEVPEYLKLKVCPLIKPENFDEIDIKEKFKNDKSVLISLSKLERARRL